MMHRNVVLSLFICMVPALPQPTMAADHWSLQPHSKPTLPRVKDEKWVRNPIDRFVLERLERAELKPVPEADAETLIRIITY